MATGSGAEAESTRAGSSHAEPKSTLAGSSHAEPENTRAGNSRAEPETTRARSSRARPESTHAEGHRNGHTEVAQNVVLKVTGMRSTRESQPQRHTHTVYLKERTGNKK